MLVNLLAAAPLLIWIYLLVGRGGFWRVSRNLAAEAPLAPASKRVVAVVPARDEAAGIAGAFTSLLQQSLAIPLQVIVVDDGSTDGTADIARAAAGKSGKSWQLTVIAGQPLAAGWTGKLWAGSQGVAHAETLAPDYLLFTDADIEHSSGNIASLVALAEAGHYDLASHMVKLACRSPAEHALIPALCSSFSCSIRRRRSARGARKLRARQADAF